MMIQKSSGGSQGSASAWRNDFSQLTTEPCCSALRQISLPLRAVLAVSANRLGFHSLCNASPCVGEVKKQQLIAAIVGRLCQFQALGGVTSAFVGRHSHPHLLKLQKCAQHKPRRGAN